MMPAMILDRPLLFVCLAAFAAVAAHADSPESPRYRDRSGTDEGSAGETTPATPAAPPSRFSRDGYDQRSQQQGPMGARRESLIPTDDRELRYERLRNRYPMPREISSDMHQAIESAQRQHGGKVLSADRMRSDGRDVYRVKLLTRSGRVRVVQMPKNDAAPDARTQQGEQ
jgi:hypothetical protein